MHDAKLCFIQKGSETTQPEAIPARLAKMHSLRGHIDDGLTKGSCLAGVNRAVGGMIATVKDGLDQPKVKARMNEPDQQKLEIAARLRTAKPQKLEVNPNIAEVHRGKPSRFAETLTGPQIMFGRIGTSSWGRTKDL